MTIVKSLWYYETTLQIEYINNQVIPCLFISSLLSFRNNIDICIMKKINLVFAFEILILYLFRQSKGKYFRQYSFFKLFHEFQRITTPPSPNDVAILKTFSRVII